MTTVAGAAVVVGVDGPPRSSEAVEIAAAEAALRHRPLRIVHALHGPCLPVPLPYEVGRIVPGEVQAQARCWLAEAAEVAAKVAPEVPATTELLTGWPADVLTRESRRAGLMVVGERGTGGLLVGSVAIHLAAHAACPVLVARGEPRGAGPVVAGVDGSASSVAALEFAFEEASLRAVPLVAVHAWSGDDWTELTSELPVPVEFWSGDAQERRVLAEALAGSAERHPDVPVRRQVVRGHAGALLSEWSRVAQLVVVGDGAAAGPALGRVSRHLIFHADCPTTVVRGRSAVAVA